MRRARPTMPRSAARRRAAAANTADGARTMPAPIWPIPGSLCAMPVLIMGSSPVSITASTSMPEGVPAKFMGGNGNAGWGASVILRIERVASSASSGVPPTNRVMAGDAAMANPPRPSVSVIAESPRSGLASSGPNPGKKRPSAGPTGVVNHSPPVAATRSPNSTPLRAIVVTRVEFSTPTAASIDSFAPAIEMFSAKWSFAGEEVQGGLDSRRVAERSDEWGKAAGQQRCGCEVAVVALVAHRQRLTDERRRVDRPRRLDGGIDGRSEDIAHPGETVEHLAVEGTEPQHLAESLVQRRERATAAVARRLLGDEHRHRGCEHPRHRSNGVVVMAGVKSDLAGLEEFQGSVRAVRPALEERRADERAAHRAAHPLELDRRPRVQKHSSLRDAGDDLGCRADAGDQRP